MKEIQSTRNLIVKERRKLHKRKYRQQEKRYLLEGVHLVEEAIHYGAVIQEVFFDERGKSEWLHWENLPECEVYLVSEEVMNTLSELPAPQGILAVVEINQPEVFELKGKWLLLDNVQDPGNVGTMIRTADAAGFDGVIVGPGTADIYSMKVLRSMQGSHFHLPIFTLDLLEAITKFQENNIPVYGTELNPEAVVFSQVEKTANVALVLGNEGAGVSQKILACTDQNLFIPIYGKAESLNVGVAAGILMYTFA